MGPVSFSTVGLPEARKIALWEEHNSRALIGLQVLAVAKVSLEEAWTYVAQREAFGKPLSAFQGVSHPLADPNLIDGAREACSGVWSITFLPIWCSAGAISSPEF